MVRRLYYVAFGIDYLANSKAFQLGDDIAVIGVGNSAMDCARTAIRNGARHVTCYARRDEECISASERHSQYHSSQNLLMFVLQKCFSLFWKRMAV